MKQSVINFFSELNPGQIFQFVLLTLTACAIPFSWNWAVWGLSLLTLTALIRFLISPNKKSPLPHPTQHILLLPILFFILYLISLTYSTNLDAGLESIGHKLPFLLFPLFFLFSDINKLGTKHLRAILYFFTISCCIHFFFYLIPSLKQVLFNDASFSTILGHHALVKHHTYYAMYFLLSLAFIYHEFTFHASTIKTWAKILLILAAIILVAFTIFIQSRAGILCLAVMVLWALFHVICIRKKYLFGTLAALIIIGSTAIIMSSLGDNYKRLTHTIVETATEGKKDIRFEISENALQVISHNWLFGVGVGDRIDQLDKNHDENFGINTEHPWPHYNPHNQYLDSWVATGILGLILLLAILFAPAILHLPKRNRNELLLALIFIVACTSLFESTLERQMGIIFFNMFYGLLLLPAATSTHYISDEQNPHKDSSDNLK